MKKDVGSFVFFLVVAGFGLACTMDVHESILAIPGDIMGPTGFPRIFGWFLFALSLASAVFSLTGRDGAVGESQLTRDSWRLILVSCGYILGISYVGFAVSTLIYLFLASCMFVRFKREKIRGIVIYSILVTGVAFTFFRLFKVYLPDTPLF